MGSLQDDHRSPVSVPMFRLNTGAEIPAVGLGTWQSAPGQVTRAVKHAISIGYRHIDAAYLYGNEEEVGVALKEVVEEGIVRREDLFVTTKLWCTYHTRVEENLDMSLKRLQLEYVDLYLMHWPIAMNPQGNHDTRPMKADGSRDLDLARSHIDTYLDMENLLATGKARAIGVANYTLGYLREVVARASVTPAVVQVELHPQLPQRELVEFCQAQGIHCTAYSPLGSTGAPVAALEEVEELARQKGVTPASILLGYHVSKGCSVLAKSVTPSRITENLHPAVLDKGDMKMLDRISETKPKRYLLPDFAETHFGWTATN